MRSCSQIGKNLYLTISLEPHLSRLCERSDVMNRHLKFPNPASRTLKPRSPYVNSDEDKVPDNSVTENKYTEVNAICIHHFIFYY